MDLKRATRKLLLMDERIEKGFYIKTKGMKFTINGKEHEIEEEVVIKQTDAYYEALEIGDLYAVHMLYISPVVISWEIIQHKVDMICLHEQYCNL